MHMKTPNHNSFLLFLSSIIISGLVYFALCVLAEFKKSEKNDLRLDGKLCYKPRSSAFGLGFGALICLCFAQVIGNLFICKKFKSNLSPQQIYRPTFSVAVTAA
ncbi:hypothetical protein CASFOL_038483 [Castilleja foliolosa]|uniref:Uncharacterized protein n=1 Tax=Castilleja foliolosa TaxID=1961234 RepID=A0ABD3BLJ0_9LAMI